MAGNLYQDWPVYVLLGAVAFFFIYVIIKSNSQEKRGKIEGEDKESKA